MQLKWSDEDALRQLAEDVVATGSVRARQAPRGAQLVHELLVHQAELEMQNEALREAQVVVTESEHRYRDLFENAPIGYVILDGATRVLSANPRARELLGPDIVGTRFTSYLVPDEAIAFERYRREVLGGTERFAGDFTITDARGRRRELRLEGLRTGQGDEWRAALSDVTVQNAAFRKLSHAERLGALGEHASGIAHDLNNLLFSITGHTEVALRSLNEEHPAYSSLIQLRGVVERCATATNQLASFSRAETDVPSVVNLNDAIGGMEVILRSLLGNDIELEIDAAASDPCIRMDVSYVEQILLTVMRNSRHAMTGGGKFRVETANLALPHHPQQGGAGATRYVRWTMTDTGVGMTEETRRRAFDPFFTTKPAGSGTGLGLSLVKSVVERSGGSVLLESELGAGTSVVIHLPCASASTSISSRPAPPR
jgi:two-component system cell cycle sensor histidine kinase/response regulator CckA